MNTTKRLLRAIKGLYRQAAASARKDYPLESFVQWPHGGHTRRACVIDHSPYAPRLKVRSVESQKEFWVDVEKLE